MFATRSSFGISSNPHTQIATIDQKLSWTRNYPINHLSMGLIHFADLWFGLKTASSFQMSDEVKYQLFFAAHSHRTASGQINFGENSGASFYVQGLKVNDVVQLYRILHAYHQHEKSQKGEHGAIFGHHLLLIEMHLKNICSSNPREGQNIIHAFQNQDKYNQLTEIREKLATAVKEATPKAPAVVPQSIVQAALAQIPDKLRISPEKMARHVNWEDRVVSFEAGMDKMAVNGLKAIREHMEDNLTAPHISLAELQTINSFPVPYNPLRISCSEFETISEYRDDMEDSHFILDFDKAAIAAVFDGHGGAQVAKLAKGRFEPLFRQQYEKTKQEEGRPNFHRAFEKAISKMQEEIATSMHGRFQGCTATIVFVDKEEHVAYIANLGDSEARLYTTIDGKNKITPLSCVRDWSSKFDATRISIIQRDPSLVSRWVNAPNPKNLRHVVGTMGINVARALGDGTLKGTKENPAVTHKPKISMQRIPDPAIYGKSVLVIGCDGLWDYTKGSYNLLNFFNKAPEREAQLADMIVSHPDPSTLAARIGNTAEDDWDSRDNITVLTLTLT